MIINISSLELIMHWQFEFSAPLFLLGRAAQGRSTQKSTLRKRVSGRTRGLDNPQRWEQSVRQTKMILVVCLRPSSYLDGGFGLATFAGVVDGPLDLTRGFEAGALGAP